MHIQPLIPFFNSFRNTATKFLNEKNPAVIQPPEVKVVRCYNDVLMPVRANSGDAGFDIHAYVDHMVVKPGESVLVPTGLKMDIPEGWCGQINPRSGLASKRKIVVGARVIDSGYRGEIFINIINLGSETFVITNKERIAQILFLPVLTDIKEVSIDVLSDTERGEGGFGSSGV